MQTGYPSWLYRGGCGTRPDPSTAGVADLAPSRTTVAVATWALLLAFGCHDAAVDEAAASTEETGEPIGEDEEPAGSTADPPLVFCEGPSRVRYAAHDGEIDAFPDDWLTQDATTATGVKVRRVHPQDALARFSGLFEGLASLDGFGTTAPAFLRVVGSLDPSTLPAPGTETDPASSSLLLIDLDAEDSTFVAFDWRIEAERDAGETLMVEPLSALRPGTRYGLALTRRARDLGGDCIAPSETMRALLSGTSTDPSLVRLGDRHAELIARLTAAEAIEGPGDLSAAIVFTTQTTLHESTTIATAIRQSSPPPLQMGTCSPHGACSRCEVTVTMADFRDEDGIVVHPPEPGSFYAVPVTAFLPSVGAPPHPTILYGHGLDGDRTYAASIAGAACEEGYAVVAIDAPKHGGHPDAPVIQPALDLMGITGDADDPFVALRARDNFRQATYDKLQLLRGIDAGLDVDGDGQPDFDGHRMHYVGVSLGAVMAPPLLAYAPQVRSATLIVGGVRLTSIISEPSELGAIVVLVTQGMQRAERARFLAMTQAALDRGDPEVFAGHVLQHRLEGFDSAEPQILIPMAVEDTIVPNSTTGHLARALGVPIAGEVWSLMREVAVEPQLPVQGNLAPGRTGALFQFAAVLAANGGPELEPATHINLQYDLLAQEQRMTFLRTAETSDGAIVLDPFVEP
jgi:pimeloyl-ACP methyl ester carboxylesterase